MTQDFYAQGDVVFEPIKNLPKNLKPVQVVNGKYIIREGEATGHKHEISAENTELFLDENGEMVIVVKAQDAFVSTTTHQEHKIVVPPPGTYKIGHTREYDPFSEESRKLRD